MKILKEKDVPKREDKGELRHYYLFNDYEIIVTKVPRGHMQLWHSHKLIRETHYLMKGQIEILEEKKTVIMKPGDLVLISPGRAHTLRNRGKSTAYVLTLKTIPNPKPHPRSIFSEDKEIKT